jgi:hypothetical protein
MAKNYKGYAYFDNNPNIVKIFDDLEAYLDFCRFELRDFNPADLYKKDSNDWKAYQYSKRPKRPYNGKPRTNWKRNDQSVSR